MKNLSFIILLIALPVQEGFVLASPVYFMQESQIKVTENTDDTEITDTLFPDDESVSDQIQMDPTISASPSLEKHTVGAVSYVSGGIGRDETDEIKQIAKNYPLEIVCVQKTAEFETYLASVIVHILDKQGNAVIDVTTEGPILLVDLPKGRYQISAEHNNVFRINHVNIGNKHQRVVFAWPNE